MNQRIKDVLGVMGVVALIALTFGLFVFADAYPNTAVMVPAFSVSGEGEIEVVPDVATFNFSVISQGDDNLAELQSENIEKTNSAIEFVKSLGIEDEDIKTSRLDISPRYTRSICRPNSVCPPQEITGYTVTQTVTVKVRDFEDLQSAFGGVVENGANAVSSLQFTIDDPSDLENQARAMAIKEAQEKAEAVAEAGGFRLGRLISIDENQVYPQFFGRGGDAEMAFEEAGAVRPTIEPGVEEVRVRVNLRYEIK